MSIPPKLETKPILLNIPMRIETARLALRKPEYGDGKALNEAILESFEDLAPWLPWADHRPSVDESEESVRLGMIRWINREELRFHVYEKQNGKFLGCVGLHRIEWQMPRFEIGYWMRTSSLKKGYATEAVGELTRFAFETLKAVRVELRCDPLNLASVRIALNLGYQQEGLLKYTDFKVINSKKNESEFADTLVFAKTLH